MGVNVLTMGDLHVGTIDPAVLLEHIRTYFIPEIKKEETDLVVFLGDWWDKAVSANSATARASFTIFGEVRDACIECNKPFRMILGTKGHDNDQLELFNQFKQDGFNFRIITHVESEFVLPNFKVLYIPEEYMEDKDEYYKDYFKGEYDMIFMHGMIKDVAFVAKNQEGELTHAKAPVFDVEELISICRGPIMSGHIHSKMIVADRFVYNGSFERFIFGEEEKKGFFRTKYDRSGNFEIEFIENKGALLMPTLEMTFDNNSPTDLREALSLVIQMKESVKYDKLRFKILIDENYPKPQLLVDAIKELFAQDKDVKIIFKSNAKIKKDEKVKEQIEKLMKMYDYLFDKSIDYATKITRFIKETTNKEISEEKIKEYIY